MTSALGQTSMSIRRNLTGPVWADRKWFPRLPLDLITVTPNPDAPRDLQAAAMAYWIVENIDSKGSPVFEDQLVTGRLKDWNAAVHVAAAAGATATHLGARCSQCGGPLTLTARGYMVKVVNGTEKEPVCRQCRGGEALARKIATTLTLDMFHETLRRRDVERKRDAKRTDAVAKVLAEHPPVDPEVAISTASVRGIIGAMAMLTTGYHAGGDTVRVYVDGLHRQNVGPSEELSERLIAAAWDDGLVSMDLGRTGSYSAFHWDLTDALLGPRFDNIVWTVDPDPSLMYSRLEEVAEHMVRKHRGIPQGIRVLAEELLTEEALRYLNRIWKHYLSPMDDHREEIAQAIRETLVSVPLGKVFGNLWRSEKGVADMFRNTSIPNSRKARAAATVIVKELRKLVERVAESPRETSSTRAFKEEAKHPLTGATNAVFGPVLKLDPMTTTLAHIDERDQALRGKPAAPSPDPKSVRVAETHQEQVALLETMRNWEGTDFRDAVEQLHFPGEPAVATPTVVYLLGIYDRLDPLIGDQQAAITVADALGLLPQGTEVLERIMVTLRGL